MCVTHSLRPVDGPTLAGSNHAMSADKEFSYDAHNRRRSVDVGGLALALGAVSLGGEAPEMGKGWGGWEESELQDALYVHLPPSMRSGVSPKPHTMGISDTPSFSATCTRKHNTLSTNLSCRQY